MNSVIVNIVLAAMLDAMVIGPIKLFVFGTISD